MHHSLQIMFILPLMTGHLFWKATILGGLYRGVPLYLHFMSFLHIGMTQVVEILPQVGQEHAYST